jgi:hypothetical protein
MKKTALLDSLKWGSFLGVGLVLIQLGIHFTNHLQFFSYKPLFELLQVLLYLFCLYMGIKEGREKTYKGNIKFSTAFVIGAYISIIASLLMAVYAIIYAFYVKRIDGIVFSTLLWGLFFSVFVAMYLYRKKGVKQETAPDENKEQKINNQENK